jgi:prepilin-type N-terminal cleavage/methylation domain-containing protein
MMNNKHGFTLIELLVVIAIIGILSSVVLASLNTARQKGRDARRISDVKQLQLALELYYDSHQTYPAATGGAPSSLLSSEGFIPAVPQDPIAEVGSYKYAALRNSGDAAAVTTCDSTNVCASYVLRATLENGANTVLGSDIDTNPIGGLDCRDITAPDYFYCQAP